MRYSFAVAAIIGAVAASPQGYGHRHEHPGKVYHTNVVVETVVKYVTMTEGYGAPSNPTPTPVYQAPPPPVVKTVVYQAPPPSSKYDSPPIIEQPTPTPQAPAPPAYTAPAYTAPAYTPSPSAAPAPSTGEPEYIGCINKWRTTMGKPTLAYNATLQAIVNAETQEMNGVMTHVVKPGVYGQVIGPAQATNFEDILVSGWLCEVPSTPGLSEQLCADWKKKLDIDHGSQTAHNEICTADRYKGVACANYKGMWACDFTLYD